MSNIITGFPPIENRSARVLILGSMPGEKSLRANQYYAHPQNSFWKIIGAVCGFDASAPYAKRIAALRAHGLALWDVVHRCKRMGSLDSAIDAASIEAGDFRGFFARHPALSSVCFNGATAQSTYKRHVLPTLESRALKYVRLPSTSPAHASLSFEKKLAAWRAALAA